MTYTPWSVIAGEQPTATKWNILGSNDADFDARLTSVQVKRITAVSSGSSLTPNADTTDQYNITALATNPTINAPTGTPTDGQVLIFRIKDNGSARGLTWNSIYRAVGVSLPTTTIGGKTMYVAGKYNAADSKWDILGVNIEV